LLRLEEPSHGSCEVQLCGHSNDLLTQQDADHHRILAVLELYPHLTRVVPDCLPMVARKLRKDAGLGTAMPARRPALWFWKDSCRGSAAVDHVLALQEIAQPFAARNIPLFLAQRKALDGENLEDHMCGQPWKRLRWRLTCHRQYILRHLSGMLKIQTITV